MHMRAGIGVLELVVGLGISAIVAGSAGLSVIGLVRSARLAGTSRALGSTLRVARGQALASGGPIEVRFDVAGRQWERAEPFGNVHERRALPPGIRFSAVPSRGRIRFSAVGTAENATVVLAAGALERRVVVNQRGRVELR